MAAFDYHTTEESLPSRERGLKLTESKYLNGPDYVAPLAGAWIEIIHAIYTPLCPGVAPLAGAWIEIAVTSR